MEIVKIKIDDLTPYKNNTKKHPQEQIDKIIKSIKDFEMNDPISVWGDENIIVEGHGRYLALKQMGRTEVDCIRLDHLTDEERRKYTIVHNQTTLDTDLDFEMLAAELEEIDLSDFDFDFPEFFEFGEQQEDEQEREEEKENERLRTDNAYHLWDFDEERTEGKWQMPTLEPCYKIPKRMIGFNYALTSTDYDACIHFYLDDYQFERVWNSPEKYIEILKRFDMVLSPSYSVYMDMAEPIKIYNVYRSRLLSQMLQDNGIHVVPIVYWADEKSFEYCFDGLPENSVLSVLTIGTTNKEVWKHWKKGMDELIKRKSPKTLLIYGNGIKVDYDFGDIKIIYYDNEVTERMKKLNEN